MLYPLLMLIFIAILRAMYKRMNLAWHDNAHLKLHLVRFSPYFQFLINE